LSERFEPPHLRSLVDSLEYKPGWEFALAFRHGETEDAPDNLQFLVMSQTTDSFDFKNTNYRVRHTFLVPPTTWNRNNWAAWLFDRISDIETHEAGEFFRIKGVREFAPHHSNGEDPYRIWHVSDWATASKSSGEY
jgi:hypothetical protein